jgi:hypothetical protein
MRKVTESKSDKSPPRLPITLDVGHDSTDFSTGLSNRGVYIVAPKRKRTGVIEKLVADSAEPLPSYLSSPSNNDYSRKNERVKPLRRRAKQQKGNSTSPGKIAWKDLPHSTSNQPPSPPQEDTTLIRRRKSVVAACGNAKMDLPIPAQFFFRRYSYVPLQELDFWDWRDCVDKRVLDFVKNINGQYLMNLSLENAMLLKSKSLDSLLADCRKLVSLNLSKTQGTTDKVLKTVASTCPRLERIDFSYCKNISGLGVAMVVDSRCGARLTHINVSGSSVSTRNDGGNYLFHVIAKKCPNLISLELHDVLNMLPGALAGSMARPRNLMDRTIQELSMPLLKTVDLGSLGNVINDQDILMIVGDRYQIEYFDLSGAVTVTDDGLRALAQKKTAWGHIGHTGYPKIKTLLLRSCSLLSDVALGWTQAGCPYLTVLDVSHCPLIGDWGFRSLSTMERLRVLRASNLSLLSLSGIRMLLLDERDRQTALAKSIEELDISYCKKVETNGAMQYVAINAPKMRFLSLRGCSIETPVVDAAFAALSSGCRSLSSLKLGQRRKKGKKSSARKSLPLLMDEADQAFQNGQGKPSAPSRAFIAPAYPSEMSIEYLSEHLSKTLTELDCSHLTNLSARALLVLRNLRTLRVLSIAGCERIDDDALQYVPTWKIEKLDLSFNPQLTDVGLVHLSKCNELQTLNVAFCANLSDNGIKSLCRTNLPILTTLNVFGCDFITKEGSLVDVLNLKPVRFHLKFFDEPPKQSKSEQTSSMGFFGFRPVHAATSMEVQRFYKEEMIRDKFAARKLQKNFKAYVVRVTFIRKMKREKARQMYAAAQIQRSFRGFVVRKTLAIELYYKSLVAVRMQYVYRKKRALRNKRRALGFFQHGVNARAFAQWKYKAAEQAKRRGETSAQELMKKALGNYNDELKKKIFSAWTVCTWIQARRGRQLKKALAFFSSKSEKRWFTVWQCNVAEKVRTRRLYGNVFMLAIPFLYHNRPELQAMEEKARSLDNLKIERKHFNMWNLRCLEQRQYLRMRARRVYRTWIIVVLRSWRKIANELGIEKRRFRKIFAQLQRGKELRILIAWREFAVDSMKGKRALGFLIHGTSVRIVAAWREFVSFRKDERHRLKQAGLVWMNIGRAQAVRKWVDYLNERRAYKRMVLRALNMMRNRVTRVSMDAWVEAIAMKHNAIARAKAYFHNAVMLKCYHALASEAKGRLDRIHAATLIQKIWRGYRQYISYLKEKMSKIWAAERIQAGWRGRQGRKLWTKKNRRKALYRALEEEKESDLMDSEDQLALEIRKWSWAAKKIQTHWRGAKQREDFFFFKIAKSREKGSLYQEAQREARELARERQKARDELNNLKWLCAVRIQLWWRGSIKGKLFLQQLKLEVLKDKKAIQLQKTFRGRLGRHKAMSKRRLKGQQKLASRWRHSQGWVMRGLGFKHRHQQQTAFKFLRPLGLQPLEFNVIFWSQVNEIKHDYNVFKRRLAIEKEVLTTAIKKRTFKWGKSIRQKGEMQLSAWEKKTVAPHMACRIIKHKDESLIGHTGYILNIDMDRGSHGMAEIKMDMDGSLRYVLVMTDGTATEAPMRGVIQTDSMNFESMPKNISTSWRQSLRLWAETEVNAGIEFRAARRIQCWIRCIQAIKHTILKSLDDKEKELRHRADTFDILMRYNIPQNTRWRFLLANLMILRRGGGWGNKKYKYYPEMPIRPFIPLHIFEWNIKRKRRKAVANELTMIIQKRRAEVKDYREANPGTDVPPFVRNPIIRWWRKRKARKARLKEERLLRKMQQYEEAKARKKAKRQARFEKFERVGKAAVEAGIEWKTVAKEKKKTRVDIDEKMVRQMFETFDTDGSGEIDTQELQVLAYALGEVWDDEKVASVMNKIDKDGSNAIDFKEFYDWFMSGDALSGSREDTGQDPDDVVQAAYRLKFMLKRKILLGKVRSWFRNSMKRLPRAFGASIRANMAAKVSTSDLNEKVERGAIIVIEIKDGIASCTHDGLISSLQPGDKITISGSHEGLRDTEHHIISTPDPTMFMFETNGMADTEPPHYQKGYIHREIKNEFIIHDISISYGTARLTHDGGFHGKPGDCIVIEGNDIKTNGQHTISEIVHSNALSFKIKSEDTHDHPFIGGTFKLLDKPAKDKKKVRIRDADEEIEEESEYDENGELVERQKNYTRIDLKANVDVSNRRDELIWADIWWFQQLTISKYVPGGGYCLVHGEWDKVKLRQRNQSHVNEQNVLEAATTSNIDKKAVDAIKAAKMAEVAAEEGGVEEIAESVRLAEMLRQEEDLVGAALLMAQIKRKFVERRLKKRKKKKKELKLPIKFVPNGAGIAIFPVQRTGFTLAGLDNTDDFGKVVVGEFCLRRVDIRDITYSRGLLKSFKDTLAGEIAKALRISYYRVHIFEVDDATVYDTHYRNREHTKVYAVRESFRRGLPAKYNFVTEGMNKKFIKEQEDFQLQKEARLAEEDLTKTDMRRRYEFVRDKGIEYYHKADTIVNKFTGRHEPCPPVPVQIIASGLQSRVKVKFHIDPPKNGMKEPTLEETRFDFMRQALKRRSRIRRTRVYLYKLVAMSLRMQSIGGHGSVGRSSYSARDAHGFEAGMGIVAAHNALTIVEQAVRQEDIDKERLNRERQQRGLKTALGAAKMQKDVEAAKLAQEKARLEEIQKRKQEFEETNEFTPFVDGEDDDLKSAEKGENGDAVIHVTTINEENYQAGEHDHPLDKTGRVKVTIETKEGERGGGEDQRLTEMETVVKSAGDTTEEKNLNGKSETSENMSEGGKLGSLLREGKGRNWLQLRSKVKKERRGKDFMDYRPFKTRRHVRTNWPQIHTLEGIFQHGIISGKVFINFHDKSKYSGPWVEAMEERSKDHVGTWTTPTNVSFTGPTVDNHFDSEHATGPTFTVKFPNGDAYEGPLLESRRAGFGVCNYEDGSKYHGNWFEDRKHGVGRLFVPDEKLGGTSEYNGSWRHDKKHGFGMEHFPDGSSYEGEFFQDLWHGQGMRYFANGDVYSGDFMNGRMWGKGEFHYIDGRTYKGDMVRDNRHGYGVLVYPRAAPRDARSNTGKILVMNHNVALSTTDGRGPSTKVDPDEDPSKPETRTADRFQRGVMALRGDWGPLGKERYEGPFVDDKEHGEALWVVPTSATFEERRYGRWEMGDRVRWLTMPATEEASQAFVDMFSEEEAFRGVSAAMIARFLPHLPPGVNGADPAVKLIAQGVLRFNQSIAGDAVIIEVQDKLVGANQKCDEAEENFEVAKDILIDAQEILEEHMESVQAIRDNEADHRQQIWNLEKIIKEHWEHQPKDYLGRYERALGWINRIQLKSWHKARAVIKPRAPVNLIYEAICIMLDKPKDMENAIRLLNDRHLNVKAGDRESITREYDVKLKDVIDRGEFDFYDLIKMRGEFVKGKQNSQFQSVWLLRPYVENIEFRADSAKFEEVADCLCALVEWVIAAYKCAIYALPIVKHRDEIRAINVRLGLILRDLDDELLDLKHVQKEYDDALIGFNNAKKEFAIRKRRKNDLIEKIHVIQKMKETGQVPRIARDWELPNLRANEPYQPQSTNLEIVLKELNEDRIKKEMKESQVLG